jgi:hypothetical protein
VQINELSVDGVDFSGQKLDGTAAFTEFVKSRGKVKHDPAAA